MVIENRESSLQIYVVNAVEFKVSGTKKPIRNYLPLGEGSTEEEATENAKKLGDQMLAKRVRDGHEYALEYGDPIKLSLPLVEDNLELQ